MAKIEEAITSTEEAILWVAEEHRYLKELIEFIKKIKNLDLEQQEKDLKIAFRLYRGVEAAKKRAEQAETRTEIELKGMARALPKKWHAPLINIISQLDALSKELLKKTSPLFSSIHELSIIGSKFSQDEFEAAMLFYSEPETEKFKKQKEKFKQQYAEFKQKKEEVMAGLRILLEKLSSNIEKITPLLDSMEAVLKQARAFERRIAEAITEQSIQKYLRYWPAVKDEIKKGNIPWQDLVKCMPKISIYMHEAILLFPFMENIVRLCKERKIDTIIALDKSGRLLGFLVHQVLLNLGMSKGMEFYFINPKDMDLVTKYPDNFAKGLKGKRVLIIDEYIFSGSQMSYFLRRIKSIRKKGELCAAAFSSIAPEEGLDKDKEMHGNIGREYAVYNKTPSWYFFKEYSGVREVESEMPFAKRTQAEPRIREIAAAVRNALIPLAKVIAQYLRNKGY